MYENENLSIPEVLNDNENNNVAFREEKLPFYKDITPKQMLSLGLKRSVTYDFEFESLINKINSK